MAEIIVSLVLRCPFFCKLGQQQQHQLKKNICLSFRHLLLSSSSSCLVYFPSSCLFFRLGSPWRADCSYRSRRHNGPVGWRPSLCPCRRWSDESKRRSVLFDDLPAAHTSCLVINKLNFSIDLRSSSYALHCLASPRRPRLDLHESKTFRIIANFQQVLRYAPQLKLFKFL